MRCIQVCDKVQSVQHLGPDRHRLAARPSTCRDNRRIEDSDCTLLRPVHHPLSRRRRCSERDDTGLVFDALADPNEDHRGRRSRPRCARPGPSTSASTARVRHRPSAWSPRCASWASTMCSTPTFAADLTIMEEGSEFIERFTHRDQYQLADVHLLLPRLGAVREVPVPRTDGSNLSTAKSPQQMFGAVAKSYFAEKVGIDPKRHLRRVHHALRRQKERVRAADDEGRRAATRMSTWCITTRELVRMFRGEPHRPRRSARGGRSTARSASATGAAVDLRRDRRRDGRGAAQLRTTLSPARTPTLTPSRAVRGMDGLEGGDVQHPRRGRCARARS